MPEFEKKNSDGLGDSNYSYFGNAEMNARPKVTFILVGLIGVVALFLGFLRISQNIKSPFQPTVSFTDSSFLSEDQLAEINLLKTKDTDSDGLSDYDELYYHNTSPYLKDSDSDSFSDKEEVESLNDPNCPVGTDCAGLTTDSNTNTSVTDTNTNSGTSIVDPKSSILSGGATASTLRETLKNAGVPQNILDSTDDETLLEIYNQTISETEATNTNTDVSNTNTLTTSTGGDTDTAVTAETPPDEFYEALQQLTPSEIRLLLIDSGVDEAQLNLIDDASLEAIFLKALEEEAGQ